jgi:lipid A 3-O-deacylase
LVNNDRVAIVWILGRLRSGYGGNLFGIFLSLFLSAAASAADMSAGTPVAFQPPRPLSSWEFRFGAFAHGVGSIEKGSVDVNAEIMAPRFAWAESVGMWSFLVPRLHAGAMLNTGGRTSYGYAGFAWTWDVGRFFFEPFLGGALHNGSLAGDATHSALGCRWLIHSGGSVGYRVTDRLSVMATFDHLSNGKAAFDACPRNVGINDWGIRVGYTF